MSTAIELDLPVARAWFDALPASRRLVSLSPDFAVADQARDARLTCRHVGYREADAMWLHTMHLKPMPYGDGAWGALSPYGYGGPLATGDDPTFVARAWAAYTAWCRAQQVVAEFCRFHPEAAHERCFGGTVQLNRQTVSVDLTGPDPVAQFSTLARRKVRRAEAQGFQPRWSQATEDWRRYGAFYRAAMQAMGAAAWYHFADGYFEALAALPAAWLCVCERSDGWGSAGVYLVGPEVVEYHLGASSSLGHASGTAFQMQQAAALRGQALGARSLYLGGGTDAQEDNPLLFYKKSFSKRLRPFHIGQAIHDDTAYWTLAARAGFSRAQPPARVLLD